MPRKRVTRTLASGEVKVYEYDRARRPSAPRTMGAVIAEYRQSAAWRRLADSTKRQYLKALDELQPFHDVEVAKIRKRHILQHQDALFDKPAFANQVVNLWRILMGFAHDRDYIASSPAVRIRNLQTGEFARWPEDLVERAVMPGHLPEHLRRAVVLGLYTGQRESDCVRMTWRDLDGTVIRVVQQKTGAKVWIPCHSALRAELAVWRQGTSATTILTRAGGEPWGATQSFCTMMSRELRRRPEFDGFVFHGLRKVAAARLAEAGCPPHEIAAITGHASLEMIQHYTREVEQKRLAESAIERLENWRRGKTGKTPT